MLAEDRYEPQGVSDCKCLRSQLSAWGARLGVRCGLFRRLADVRTARSHRTEEGRGRWLIKRNTALTSIARGAMYLVPLLPCGFHGSPGVATVGSGIVGRVHLGRK
jgi:hypothetical protein